MKVTLSRVDDAYHFVGRNPAGNELHFDNPPEEGGAGQGVGPMQSVAMALGGCSAFDVVSILQKARQQVTRFDIEVEYERDYDQIPAIFTSLHVHYALEGDLDPQKVRRAVQLSVDKYCSISKILRTVATLTHSFSINGTRYE